MIKAKRPQAVNLSITQCIVWKLQFLDVHVFYFFRRLKWRRKSRKKELPKVHPNQNGYPLLMSQALIPT